ncbi:hypothetical protein HK102_007909 [Quaeritorhiza haematococci]|nr:hypothetical protein HK102_007909 [Quaeritorhiza haematococci]
MHNRSRSVGCTIESLFLQDFKKRDRKRNASVPIGFGTDIFWRRQKLATSPHQYVPFVYTAPLYPHEMISARIERKDESGKVWVLDETQFDEGKREADKQEDTVMRVSTVSEPRSVLMGKGSKSLSGKIQPLMQPKDIPDALPRFELAPPEPVAMPPVDVPARSNSSTASVPIVRAPNPKKPELTSDAPLQTESLTGSKRQNLIETLLDTASNEIHQETSADLNPIRINAPDLIFSGSENTSAESNQTQTNALDLIIGGSENASADSNKIQTNIPDIIVGGSDSSDEVSSSEQEQQDTSEDKVQSAVENVDNKVNSFLEPSIDLNPSPSSQEDVLDTNLHPNPPPPSVNAVKKIGSVARPPVFSCLVDDIAVPHLQSSSPPLTWYMQNALRMVDVIEWAILQIQHQWRGALVRRRFTFCMDAIRTIQRWFRCQRVRRLYKKIIKLKTARQELNRIPLYFRHLAALSEEAASWLVPLPAKFSRPSQVVILAEGEEVSLRERYRGRLEMRKTNAQNPWLKAMIKIHASPSSSNDGKSSTATAVQEGESVPKHLTDFIEERKKVWNAYVPIAKMLREKYHGLNMLTDLGASEPDEEQDKLDSMPSDRGRSNSVEFEKAATKRKQQRSSSITNPPSSGLPPMSKTHLLGDIRDNDEESGDRPSDEDLSAPPSQLLASTSTLAASRRSLSVTSGTSTSNISLPSRRSSSVIGTGDTLPTPQRRKSSLAVNPGPIGRRRSTFAAFDPASGGENGKKKSSHLPRRVNADWIVHMIKTKKPRLYKRLVGGGGCGSQNGKNIREDEEPGLNDIERMMRDLMTNQIHTFESS